MRTHGQPKKDNFAKNFQKIQESRHHWEHVFLFVTKYFVIWMFFYEGPASLGSMVCSLFYWNERVSYLACDSFFNINSVAHQVQGTENNQFASMMEDLQLTFLATFQDLTLSYHPKRHWRKENTDLHDPCAWCVNLGRVQTVENIQWTIWISHFVTSAFESLLGASQCHTITPCLLTW